MFVVDSGRALMERWDPALGTTTLEVGCAGPDPELIDADLGFG